MHFSMHQYIHSHPQNINHCRVIRYPGARELNGAVDLISHYKLDPQHEFFCRRPLPGPISETHYLHNVPGDTEIRRGAGMELDQLFNPNLIPPSFPPSKHSLLQHRLFEACILLPRRCTSLSASCELLLSFSLNRVELKIIILDA